jgi:hypothetical protein
VIVVGVYNSNGRGGGQSATARCVITFQARVHATKIGLQAFDIYLYPSPEVPPRSSTHRAAALLQPTRTSMEAVCLKMG